MNQGIGQSRAHSWYDRLLVWLLAALVVLAVPSSLAAADTEAQLFQKAETSRKQLEASKAARNSRQSWLEVINRYLAVTESYPNGKLAEKSLLVAGDLFVNLYSLSRRQEDLDSALITYRRLLKNFPQGDMGARCQLAIGQVYYYHKKDPERAYVELLKVELNHPQNKAEVAEARKLMTSISGPPAKDKNPGSSAAAATSSGSPETDTTNGATDSAPPPPGSKASVKGLRYWHNPIYSRVAVDLDREVTFRDHILRPAQDKKQPMRLYLDLKDARLAPNVKEELAISDGLLQKARLAQYDASTVRLVLDVQNIHNYRIFSLSNPFRIVVDVTGKSSDTSPDKHLEASAPSTPPAGSPPDQPPPRETLSEKAPAEKTVPEKPAPEKVAKTTPGSAGPPDTVVDKTPPPEKKPPAPEPAPEKKTVTKPEPPAEKTTKSGIKPDTKPSAKPETKPETHPPTPKVDPKAKPDQPLADLRDTALKRKQLPRGPAHGEASQESLARQLGLGVRKVIIDPGHGGKDVGATGVTGLREKELTLDFSRVLAAKIKERLGLAVSLTRDKDTFMPLEERTAMANTQGADLFVSIHANSHPSAAVNGLETYVLNIATDKEAMRVAVRENAATTKNMSDLQAILKDLMLNSKIAESGGFGVKVHRALVSKMGKKTKVHDLGVKQAPFYVLIGANMPSILIEIGFISNKMEESRLKDRQYLEQLAEGIVEGIKAYIGSIKKTG